MSLLRPGRLSTTRAIDPSAGKRAEQIELRRATRSGHVCSGTVACPRCDAPVAVGPCGVAIGERLHCPFCAHAAPVRDFLSLAAPVRPARVTVRLRLPGGV